MLKIVNLCVTDKEKKFLLINRIKKPYIGYWGMLGGKIEKDEEADSAASRELFEESGIKSEGKFLGKCHEQIFENNELIAEFEIYVYHFVADNFEINFDSHEGELKWFSLEELKKEKIIPSDVLMIDAFLNKRFRDAESIVKKEKENYFQEKFDICENSLKIIDKAYGEEIIKEPVLIELINSKPVQRLKGISQYGVPDEYYHKINYSRFEHSIGVLLLLRKLGADLDEQVAGLLHDVSHTAFSHVVDWVIGDPTKEDYQDNNHFDIIKNSEIPELLKKYGFSYEKVSTIERFSLLEKSAPSLCADRIDYTLRELEKEGKDINTFITNLINYNGQIVFKEKEAAKNFAHEYLNLQNEHWAGAQAKIRYYILASILKRALEEGFISFEDLYKTDEEVINKLILCNDNFIKNNLKLLREGLAIEEVNDDSGTLIKKKFRYIDPEILVNGEVKKVSEVFGDYSDLLDIEKINSNIQKRYIYHAICS